MVCIFVCCFLYCNLLQLTKVEGLLLPFLYIHTCVIFNKCIQTLKTIALGELVSGTSDDYCDHVCSTIIYIAVFTDNYRPSLNEILE